MRQTFHAYDAALAMVAALRPVLAELAKGDRALTDQVRRAASSVTLNLAEGNRRMGQDRLQFFRIAAGSAAEVRAALEVARAWGYIDAAAVAEAELDRVLAMVWRLTHRRE
jgi:four helix bundle protein